MDLRGVYAITDSVLLADDALLDAVGEALAGGIALLQYREKAKPPEQRLAQAIALRRLCEQYGVPLIINDDIDLCVAAGASGVHLGRTDGSVAVARQQLGRDAIVGATCHADVAGALAAQAQGASYVAFGRFYPSRTKPDAPPASLAVLREARARLDIPLVAIGGITAENAPAVIDAGADLVAVIDYLFAGDAVRQRARLLARCFD